MAKLAKRLLVLAVSGLLFGAAPWQTVCAQYADFTDKFEMDKDYWDENNEWGVDMESKLPIMGVSWKTHAFKFLNGRLSTGINSLDFVATLASSGPVVTGLKRVVLEQTISDYDLNISKLRGIRLVMSGDLDFSDAVTVFPESMPVHASDPFLFEIPEPTPGMYYKFEIDFQTGGHRDCWIKVDRLKFYDMTWNGIEGVVSDSEAAEEEWYTPDGVRVRQPGRGLYIRRCGPVVGKVMR